MLPILLLLFTDAAPAQSCVADDPLDQAIAIQLPIDGLDGLGALGPALVPTLLGDEGLVVDDIIEDDIFGCTSFGLTGAWAELSVDDVIFEVNNGMLDVIIDLTVWINSSQDRFAFFYDLDILFDCVGDDCEGWVEPFPVSARIPIGLDVVTGADGYNVLDSSIGDIQINNGLDGDLIHFNAGCSVQLIENVLNLFGISLFDFIVDLADDLLLGQLDEVIGDLEGTLDDALTQLIFADTIDVLETSLDILVEPYCVDMGQDGVEILLHGSADAAPHDCVRAWDQGDWTETGGARPALTDALVGAHAGILVADDFVTQLSYMAWSGGLLCYEIQDGDVSGFPIDANLLSLLGGDGYNEILPEQPGPLTIKTIPMSPPSADFGGENDITLVIRDMQIGFFTDIDGRQARALSLDLEADVGVNLTFDDTTGELAIDLALGPEEIRATAGNDIMVAGVQEYVDESFAGVMEGILDLVVGDLLSGLAFPLPAIEGAGVSQLQVTTEGGGEWLGAWVAVDTVTYGDGAGCDETGGCDSSGCADASSCDQGCATSGGNLAGWLVFAVPLIVLRRRQLA